MSLFQNLFEKLFLQIIFQAICAPVLIDDIILSIGVEEQSCNFLDKKLPHECVHDSFIHWMGLLRGFVESVFLQQRCLYARRIESIIAIINCYQTSRTQS